MTSTTLRKPTSVAPSSTTCGEFKNFGQQLLAVREAELLRIGGGARTIDPRLLSIQHRAVAAGASEQVPADGGFLVQPEFANEILFKVYDTSTFLSRCRHYPITVENSNGVKIAAFDEQSRADGSRFGGVRGYWENEGDTVTASKPKYKLLELSLKKLFSLGYATSEMLQDAALLGAAMETAFVGELKFKAEYAALFGTGAGQLLGCLNAGNNALITVAKESGQSAATIVAENVRKMFGRMWAPSRSRAVWLVNQEVEQLLPELTIAVGNAGSELPLFHWAEEEGQFNMLMGRPVVPLEYMSALGTQGDICLVDPGEYLIADKEGINSALSMHVRFLTDEQTFRFRWRVDGQPMWHAALTPFAGTNTLSPYVVLAARP